MSLIDPKFFLPILVDAIDDDYLFYSLDAAGRFSFLSKSISKIMGVGPDNWIGRQFCEVMTNSSRNQHFAGMMFLYPESVTIIHGECELKAEGNAVEFDITQARVLQDYKLIGFVGIARRKLSGNGDIGDIGAVSAAVNKLSKVEMQVMEMVYDGELNKTIASKLGVSIRTAECRRSRALAKLETKSFASFVKLWSRVRSLGLGYRE